MIENINIENSLLNELTDEDIREIYYDYLLSKQNYEFHYVIDADEIANYCHPFSNKQDKDFGEVADEEFIIDYLFNTSKRKIIFLEDYFNELIGTRVFLLSSLNLNLLKETVNRYKHSFLDLIKEVEEVEKDKSEYIKKIIQHYSFLLSFSTGSYKNKLNKFNNLMAYPSINIEGQIKDSDISRFLSNYKRNDKLNTKIYKNFKFQTTSKLNDINALLKTYHLTNSTMNEGKKKIFYFLSSSTEDIQSLRIKILNKEIENTNFIVEKLLSKSFSLIRSKRQLFASLIYQTFNNKDNPTNYTEFRQTIKNLKKSFNNDTLKGKIRQLAQNQNQNKEIIENLTVLYNNRKELLKNGKENDNTFKISINNFERIIEIKKDYPSDVKIFEDQISNFIKKVDSSLDEEFGKKNLKKRYDAIKQFMRHSIFETEVIDNFLLQLDSDKKYNEIKINKGDDPIESIFNVFPVLFEFDFYKKIFFPFLQEIKNLTVFDKKLLQKFTNNLDVIEASNNNIFPFILYLFLIVKYRDPSKNYSGNFFVYKRSKRLIQNYKSKIKYSSNEYIKEIKKKELADIYAIGCWAAMRSRKYKFAYKLSKEAKEEFPKDPRFDFSLALIGYSWKYEVETEGRYEWSYKKYYDGGEVNKSSIIIHCEEAIKKFRDLKNYDNEDFIKNSFIALLNFTIFCYAAKYKSLHDNLNQIDIREVKSFFKQ